MEKLASTIVVGFLVMVAMLVTGIVVYFFTNSTTPQANPVPAYVYPESNNLAGNVPAPQSFPTSVFVGATNSVPVNDTATKVYAQVQQQQTLMAAAATNKAAMMSIPQSTPVPANPAFEVKACQDTFFLSEPVDDPNKIVVPRVPIGTMIQVEYVIDMAWAKVYAPNSGERAYWVPLAHLNVEGNSCFTP